MTCGLRIGHAVLASGCAAFFLLLADIFAPASPPWSDFHYDLVTAGRMIYRNIENNYPWTDIWAYHYRAFLSAAVCLPVSAALGIFVYWCLGKTRRLPGDVAAHEPVRTSR